MPSLVPRIFLLQSTFSGTLASYKVGHLWVSVMVVSSLQNQILFHVSCQWWGKHHGPISTGLFVSNPTHTPGISIRNKEVPGDLYTSMPYLLSFNNRFTSLTFDRKIQPSVRRQIIYSHSEECTGVSWESSTLMVISLALVNVFHHWLIIKWFLPCLTSRCLFAWLESYFIEDDTKPLGVC